MIIKSMINKYRCLSSEELIFAKKYIKEKRVQISSKCNMCHGEGIYWVMIGEEPEKEACDCEITSAYVGVDYARFLQKAWKHLRKRVAIDKKIAKLRTKEKQRCKSKS